MVFKLETKLAASYLLSRAIRDSSEMNVFIIVYRDGVDVCYTEHAIMVKVSDLIFAPNLIKSALLVLKAAGPGVDLKFVWEEESYRFKNG